MYIPLHEICFNYLQLAHGHHWSWSICAQIKSKRRPWQKKWMYWHYYPELTSKILLWAQRIQFWVWIVGGDRVALMPYKAMPLHLTWSTSCVDTDCSLRVFFLFGQTDNLCFVWWQTTLVLCGVSMLHPLCVRSVLMHGWAALPAPWV